MADPPVVPSEPDKREVDPVIIPVITVKDLPKGLLVETPGHTTPNYLLEAIHPMLYLVGIAGKTFFTTFVAFWGATPLVTHITGGTVAISDIHQSVEMAASLALIPTITAVATALGLLFSKLSQKFPTLQA